MDGAQSGSTVGVASGMTAITGAHLVLIVIFAILVIIGLWYGSRLLRRRKEADDLLANEGRLDHVGSREADRQRDTLARQQTISDEEISVATPSAPVPRQAQTNAPAASSAAASPTPAQEPPSVPEPAPGGDDLTQLKGVGPRVAARLNQLGITSFAALAALSPEQAIGIDSQMGNFKGRILRDHWQEQAALLAAGDRAGYEEKFGKLG